MEQARADRNLLPTGLLIVAMLLALPGTCAVWAEPAATSARDAERTKRVQALTAEVERIRKELRELQNRPEGVTTSSVPRSELTEQPTRHMRESLESLPGMTVRQGQGPRDFTISVRGSGK